MRPTLSSLYLCFVAALLPLHVEAQADAALQAGAAKVDLTPAPDALPPNYRGINDRLYARALVVASGDTRAALVTLDAGGIPDALWREISARVESELDIPATQLLLSATHTHSAPRQQTSDYVGRIVQAVRIEIGSA